MYLVTVDPAHGVVAAPESDLDCDEQTVTALDARGFKWDATIEAYVMPAPDATSDRQRGVVDTAALLARKGHVVITR
ncbi:hypothetical protein [Streptomyces sp. NPDC048565]|uniref:hypothetical protein n=1 Tax=Streptomyces sp. NPDC048565 TaxID=3155266 RepID=UPI003441EB48